MASGQTRPSPSWSPFKHVLIVTNLPVGIRPMHITHLLSHPPVKCEFGPLRDCGVSMIQIENKLPRQETASKRKFKSFGRETTCPPTISAESTPRSSVASSVSSTTTTVVAAGLSMGEEIDFAEHMLEGDRIRDGLKHGPEVEGETMAFIHFRHRMYLWQAQAVLEGVTLDGYKPKVVQQRFDTAPFRRLLRRFWTI